MTEADLMRSIQLFATQSGYRLFRNNVGVLPDRRGIPVRYGLSPGSSDLVGLVPIVISDSHVGMTFGRFLSIEVKSRTGRLTEAQRAWLDTVTRLGGIAGVVRSIDDLEALLR